MEGGTIFELGRCPGVPIAYGFEGAFEGDFFHCCWYALVAWTVGVGPVPEETSLLDDHVGGFSKAVAGRSFNVLNKTAVRVRLWKFGVLGTGC